MPMRRFCSRRHATNEQWVGPVTWRPRGENRPAILEDPFATVEPWRASQKLQSAQLKALRVTVIALRSEVVGMACKVFGPCGRASEPRHFTPLGLACGIQRLAHDAWSVAYAAKGLRSVFRALACRARHPCAWKFEACSGAFALRALSQKPCA